MSHLHPLDSIAKDTRAALKMCEQNIVGNGWEKEYCSCNEKASFKNGKGDPRGFATIPYDEKLPHGIIPQY